MSDPIQPYFDWPEKWSWLPPIPEYTKMGTAHACEFEPFKDQEVHARKALTELKKWYEAARKADPRG